MKQKRMFLAIFLIVAMLVPTQAFAAKGGKPGGGETTTETIDYVALGDSIAYGMGATNYYGYVDLYRDYLATKGTKDRKDDQKVVLSNKSFPGIKTDYLLFQVRWDFSVRDAIRKANVITVSIGGNNLLGCASNNYSDVDTSCLESGVVVLKKNGVKLLGQFEA